jgi:hypothetical protein
LTRQTSGFTGSNTHRARVRGRGHSLEIERPLKEHGTWMTDFWDETSDARAGSESRRDRESRDARGRTGGESRRIERERWYERAQGVRGEEAEAREVKEVEGSRESVGTNGHKE